LDDVPFNHGELKLHPRAGRAFVENARSLGQIPARRKLLRELAPDYVHLLNSHAKSYLALVGRRQRIVADWDEPPTMKDLGFSRNQLERFVDRWLRRRADVRIACTSYIQELFRRKYGLETTYIPHAPYLPDYPPVTSPFTEPTFVYMGNLYPAWDHDIVLDAAVILKQRKLHPRILLMGDGPDMAKWKAFVADNGLDNVELAGFVSGLELWRRLRFAHALLFPIRDTEINRSRCPSKVFAYAQAQRPIITSRVGELPYMLGENEPTYIDSTPQAFANAMADAMQSSQLPDVNYHLEGHSWSDRADRLLAAIAAAESRN
jgi:glycosyltransferase involved in cell wall biosynthesis